MLTVEERSNARRLWTGGPAVLLETGYTLDQIRAFLAREDVASEMALLDAELKQAPAIAVRTRYGVRRQLAQLAPGAVALIARAMAGPNYARGPSGEILRDARGLPIIKDVEATPAQLRSAELVLEALDVGGKSSGDFRGDVQINVLMQSSDRGITIDDDPEHVSPEQSALSRERMRNSIDRLLAKLPEVRKRVSTALALPEPRETKATPVASRPLPRPAKLKRGAGGRNGSAAKAR